jgi:hypothetical protein
VIFKAWVGSTTFFEAISIATTLIPFIVPTIFNVMSGIYATQGNMALAGKYTSVNYYCWAVFAFVLAILIMFAGLRLIALLNEHLSSQLNRHNNMAKIKTGALKVSARANQKDSYLLFSVVRSRSPCWRDVLHCFAWLSLPVSMQQLVPPSR